MRTQLMVPAFLSLLVILFQSTAGAQSVPDDVSCGDDYWFTYTEPKGWQGDWSASGEMLSLSYWPQGVSAENTNVSIELKLVQSSNRHRTDIQIDVEDVLQRWLSLLNAFGAPENIRTLGVQHPSLPTAGATLVFKEGSSYTATIDVRSGRGNYFVAILSKRGGAAEATELALFRDTIASIEFDPRRGCAAGKDGERVTVSLPGPDSQPASAAAEPKREFNLASAGSGCATLGELFVPVYCRMIELQGDRALLVFFDDDDGSESAVTYLERFKQRVAVPFCYEAKRNPKGAPQLVFYAENSPEGRLYDCGASELGEAVQLSDLE